jgi:hypothetical protein
VEKTTVYLTPEQKRALAAAATEQGRSEARLIRDGIDAVIERHRTGEAAATYGATQEPPLAPREFERPRWLGREEFVRRFELLQADADLAADLRALAPDTTADLDAAERHAAGRPSEPDE